MHINEPIINVGIMFANAIEYRINGEKETHKIEKHSNGEIVIDGLLTELPYTIDAHEFELLNVTIGINFHWQRQENQKFRGSLKFIDEGLHLTAINVLPLEEYLRSVISSEMSATSPKELLKAHAVISRSWLLAQRDKQKNLNGAKQSRGGSKDERIEWWDREDHANFDVCADDHCQRYQGISKASTPQVEAALQETLGEVLTFQNTICDARFSKCCGGVTESFENTWENTIHPYLTRVTDAVTPSNANLTNEQEARTWILKSHDSFCNTHDKSVLSSVLNNYDQETPDFYRWRVFYSTEQLSKLIKEKLGDDFGTIIDLQPMERGVSGRITKLKIVGTAKSMVIGKELLIRKALSETHLYSSAFVVEKENNGFTLIGSGWGHGVGLCQIGAAVMATKGYTYTQILQHYFPGTNIEKIY